MKFLKAIFICQVLFCIGLAHADENGFNGEEDNFNAFNPDARKSATYDTRSVLGGILSFPRRIVMAGLSFVVSLLRCLARAIGTFIQGVIGIRVRRALPDASTATKMAYMSPVQMLSKNVRHMY